MGETVVSGRNPAEVLEPSEHTLDRVAIAIEVGREAVLPTPVDLGRDVGRGPFALDLVAHRIGVVALVAVQDFSRAHPVEQDVGRYAIGDLAAGQQERDRTAEAIGQGVDFRRPSATRAADRLGKFPPLPPEAQR